MQQIRKNSYIKALVYSFQLFVTKMAIWVSIIIFVLTGNVITAQFVYVVTSFYTILRPVLTKRLPEGATHLAEAQISVKRITDFLMKEEIDQQTASKALSLQNCLDEKELSQFSNNLVELSNVYVKWNQKFEDYSLQNVSMHVSAEEMAVVVGPVGSGKTTLLHAILRELPPLKGDLHVNGK